ncbi:N-terminal domain of Peptidase_S41 [Nannocystis exedens]|uniref:N-terminal domain of Peptidase_S41 n=1 Tax=Nannocystis exedens TaxID=54 RepID=A0A1I2H316_9BACT|nr:S41 family peptidase [Nannocystis exedens]PCC67101.1 carboxy-terminal protease [Nannocystis exedens]SFF23793.1 N-terminal domain of Peptidase_S41 [Nannocystis exedens]
MRLSTVMFGWLAMSTVYAIGCAPAAVARPAAAAPTSGEPQMAVPEAPAPRGPDGAITAAERDEAIEALARELTAKYVFPAKGTEVAKAIRARRKRGEYDKITTGHALATTLTNHINEVLRDAHFHVRFSKETLPPRPAEGKPSAEELARFEEFSRHANGGFEKVERLPGNIGYLEVRGFAFPGRGFEAATAAMAFLSETDALIIDLRRNGGGSPEMVAYLCSYLFDERVHLNDLYFRPGDETRQFWTAPVPGKPYVDREVYVLTSKRTGSAAEEFAYNLKNLKRATIVGEVTWGGANPGDMVRLGDHFAAFVPTGRAISPITKTNWEGVGVQPDIPVPADDALRVVQVKLLEQQIAKAKDPGLKAELEERLRELQPK